MTRFILKFLERPKSHKVGFWIGSLVFLGFIFWQYIYSPLANNVTKLETTVENLRSDKANEQRLVKNLVKVKKAVKELDQHLSKAILELPNKGEIPDLLTSISNLAKESGLDVKTFRPRPESLEDFYAQIPVHLQVSGSYHQVASFFDEVGRMDRIVNISEIVIKDPSILKGSTKADIDATCVATTFRYLEEAEKEEASQKAAKQPGGA